MEKKVETTISAIGPNVLCRPMINKSPSLKGRSTRIPFIIPIQERGFMN